MIVEEFKNHVFHISNDIYITLEEDPRFGQREKTEALRRSQRTIKKHGVVFDHDEASPAVLFAHGGKFKGKWSYCDDDSMIPIQEWVDQNDGIHPLLAINACNPDKSTLTAKHSVLTYPRGLAGRIDVSTNFGGFTIMIPFLNKMNLYIPE